MLHLLGEGVLLLPRALRQLLAFVVGLEGLVLLGQLVDEQVDQFLRAVVGLFLILLQKLNLVLDAFSLAHQVESPVKIVVFLEQALGVGHIQGVS